MFRPVVIVYVDNLCILDADLQMYLPLCPVLNPAFNYGSGPSKVVKPLT